MFTVASVILSAWYMCNNSNAIVLNNWVTIANLNYFNDINILRILYMLDNI